MDPDITLGDYIRDYWAPTMRKRVEASTARNYESDVDLHIPEALKQQAIATIRRGQLKSLVAALLDERRLALATVAKVAYVLQSIFASALDDEAVQVDPAAKIIRAMGMRRRHIENIKAMDAGQLARFLTMAREKEQGHYVELATLAYTGIRIGELRGLQVQDVHLKARTVSVERQVRDDGAITGPMGRLGKRRTRVVDLADDLANILRRHLVCRQEYDLMFGRRSPWLIYPDFSAQPTRGQIMVATDRLRQAMRRVLAAAGLPAHFHPHALRHTFATLLLTRGEDLVYVARQLGNTLRITVELYGQHARPKSRFGGPNLLAHES